MSHNKGKRNEKAYLVKLHLLEAIVSLFLIIHVEDLKNHEYHLNSGPYLDQFECHTQPISFPLSLEHI